MKLSRRHVIGGATATTALIRTPALLQADTGIVLNDASRLNPTPVFSHWVVQANNEQNLIARLRAELADATAAKRPVCLGVARHSMGRQSLAQGGTALTFENATCETDIAAGTYRVQAGARWRDVIAALDPIGSSPVVMQSNNDFGIASTFSVNAHGWPVLHPPFGSTVRSLRLMLADGTIQRCSPTENVELFRLAMGGYGLFGIILDLDVEMTRNALLVPRFERMPSRSFGNRFRSLCADPAVSMAYGRLDVSPNRFLDEALMIGFKAAPAQNGPLPRAGTGGWMSSLSRRIYREQTDFAAGKWFRWFVEASVAPLAEDHPVTRNTLLNEPVANLAGLDRRRTDILHEYFVPADRFADFIQLCQAIIPRSGQDLLNVTLRYINADKQSLLAYAPSPRVSAVMSFSQLMTNIAEAGMRDMTRALVEGVIAIGGSFYLPYRLHARSDQVHRAYPAAQHFAARKRHYDSGLLFRNGLWNAWFAELSE